MRRTALALVAIPLVAAVLARRTITVAPLARLLAIVGGLIDGAERSARADIE